MRFPIAVLVILSIAVSGCREESSAPRSKEDELLLKFNSGNKAEAAKYSSGDREKK